MSVRDPKAKAEKLGVPSPEEILSNLKEQAEPAEKQKWLSYKIEVITPIFGGGVKAGEPDTKMPIRASAIRGQLRYWWRFLQRNRTDGKALSGEKLFKAERDIWGGMAEGEEDHSSKVKLRVENVPNVTSQEYPRACPPEYKQIEYALFAARKQNDKPASKLITQQVNFDLKICASDQIMGEVLPVLSWWASFGGIGARTRRGVGSIKITCVHGNVLTVSDSEIARHQCQRACLPPQNDSFEAWKTSIQLLQEFRQLYPKRQHGEMEWVGVGRRKKHDARYSNYKDNIGPSISNWPEANAIRKTTRENGRHPPLVGFPHLTFHR